MNDRYEGVADYMAKAGYETMFDNRWAELSEHSIERKMWHKIALNMLAELWRVYKVSATSKGEK